MRIPPRTSFQGLQAHSKHDLREEALRLRRVLKAGPQSGTATFCQTTRLLNKHDLACLIVGQWTVLEDASWHDED